MFSFKHSDFHFNSYNVYSIQLHFSFNINLFNYISFAWILFHFPQKYILINQIIIVTYRIADDKLQLKCLVNYLLIQFIKNVRAIPVISDRTDF